MHTWIGIYIVPLSATKWSYFKNKWSHICQVGTAFKYQLLCIGGGSNSGSRIFQVVWKMMIWAASAAGIALFLSKSFSLLLIQPASDKIRSYGSKSDELKLKGSNWHRRELNGQRIILSTNYIEKCFQILSSFHIMIFYPYPYPSKIQITMEFSFTKTSFESKIHVSYYMSWSE